MITNTRHLFLSSIASLVVGFASLPVVAADNSAEAVKWLDKMAHALRNENYEGVFTYMRGRTFDTVHITHKAKDGKESERLYNLSGEVREVRRENDEVVCYHPVSAGDPSEVFLHSPVNIGPFSPVFSERVTASQDVYHATLHGDGRIAGREAVKMAISPNNDDRYGYRLWLDKETGILLQSHLIDGGRVKEIFQFTSITIGEPTPVEEIAEAISGETISHRLSLDSPDVTEKPVWRVAWLPVGFHPVRVQGNRLHFSDGVATFSVFIEQSGVSSLPEMTTTVGGTVVITRRPNHTGPQITVVGEVPVNTARRVADSIEPVLY